MASSLFALREKVGAAGDLPSRTQKGFSSRTRCAPRRYRARSCRLCQWLYSTRGAEHTNLRERTPFLKLSPSKRDNALCAGTSRLGMLSYVEFLSLYIVSSGHCEG